MNKIKLGSHCLTMKDKKFNTANGEIVIPKGTIVTFCEIFEDKNFVLIESEEYGMGLDYDLDEISLLRK